MQGGAGWGGAGLRQQTGEGSRRAEQMQAVGRSSSFPHALLASYLAE